MVPRRWRVTVLICAGVFLLAGPLVSAQGAYQIRSIRAYLYYQESATFDTRDIVAGQMTPFNAVIGEGGAKGPSSATLVVVELSGPAFSGLKNATVELVAVAEGKTLLKQQVDLARFFANKKSLSVPFIVDGTGCGAVKLTATVKGLGGQVLTKTATANFVCGE